MELISTGFKDRDNNEIFTHSLIIYHGLVVSNINLPLVASLIVEQDGECGIYVGDDFRSLNEAKASGNLRYFELVKKNANDEDLINSASKGAVISKRSLSYYCEYCMGNGAFEYTGLGLHVNSKKKQLIINKKNDSEVLTYKFQIKACPFCGSKFDKD